MSQLDQAVAEAREAFATLTNLMATHGVGFSGIEAFVQSPVGLGGVSVAMAYEQWARKMNAVACILAHQEGKGDSSRLTTADRQRFTVGAFTLVQEAAK
ncbi:hypothetical protein [Actinomadura sp. 9N407]|uniref:hypothetical protein n=1 Tax=Actinomadura sp. 9N407 TaxID=3375154 RepID=UPI0037A6E2B3